MHWPGKKKYPGGEDEFRATVSPAAVLELVRIARSALSEEELQELGGLLEELTTYVKVVPDESGTVKSASRAELVLRVRHLRGLLGI